MAKFEIVQTIDTTNSKVTSAEELKDILVRFFSARGRAPEVEAISDSAVRITFDDEAAEKAETNVRKASDLCSEGRLNAAKDLLLKAVKACPGFPEAHRLLGQVLYQQGEIDKGMDEVLNALLVDPKNLWALIMMGNILANGKGKPEAADRYYKRVLEFYPDNAVALNNVGGNCLRRDDYDGALRYLMRALELDDSYVNSYYGIALALYRKKELAEAFDYASQGALKGADRAENPGVRQELLKLLLTIARDIVESADCESMVFDAAHQLERDFGAAIRFEEDDEQGTLAHLEFADFHHRKEHVVKYKRDGNYCHHMLHELMHLEMMLSAKKAGTLKAIGYKQENFDLFLRDNERHFSAVRKRLGAAETERLAKSLFQGISTQAMNCPLDLFVEQRIFERERFRPMQLLSLFAMEGENVDAVRQGAKVAEFPQSVKDANKLMNIVQSLMLRRLYGLDFVGQYAPSPAMLSKAESVLESFEETLAAYRAGDEYALFETTADSLGLKKYFSLSAGPQEAVKTEAEREQEKFEERHSPENMDPAVTMMMASYMVGALQRFHGRLPEEIREVAFECALVGQNGINPANKSGYRLKSVPDKDFGGYELLAYYYVSWALTAPEMVPKLRLPFDDAYELAKQQFDALRGNG